MKLTTLFRKKSIEKILAENEQENSNSLNKILGVRDLTALGIAAIIGAGIFSSIGRACFDGGPAISLLFIFTAIACAFSALCYAEFASRIPIAGSAYTYSYATFGEIIAWIIGWDLIMEYSIGNITVAAACSSNIKSFLEGLGITIPNFLSTSYMEAYKAHHVYLSSIHQHAFISENIKALESTWSNAPRIGNLHLILNIPAFLSVFIITLLAYIGIRESKRSTNIMVIFKIIIILLVIVIGIFYINPINWHPFAPHGFVGVMKGVSAVFFAYVGFDAISTTAEECKNPQRDLPRAMIYSLIICTILYVAIALVLTGMVHYTQLDQGDFLAASFKSIGLNWVGGLLALSAVIATFGVMLVFQLGQPRIWMSMSRDGLLPKKFSTIHPKFKTPSFSNWITFLLVGIPALVVDSELATDMNSIGTLFAFMLVCGGILVLRNNTNNGGKFKVPYINGKYVFPIILVCILIGIGIYKPELYTDFFNLQDPKQSSLQVFWYKIPYFIFTLSVFVILFFTIKKNLSLIPVLGLLSCFYLITEMGVHNWMRFLIWLAIGLVIYFMYSIRKSKLNKK